MSERKEQLMRRLAHYAIVAEYDYPGDSAVFCGYWCEECKSMIETDGRGHEATCILHGVAPNTDPAP